MIATETRPKSAYLEQLLNADVFRPEKPKSVEDSGVSPVLVENLILTYLLEVGSARGRGIAKHLALPFGVLEETFQSLRARRILVHNGQAPLNDYTYVLTDQGIERAHLAQKACSYVGPLPVPLEDYILSVEAQSIRAESPQKAQLAKAFKDISVESDLFDDLGPAINSGAGLFLYGEPGNGKTTIAKRITKCFCQDIWIPHALIEDGQIVKLFDGSVHEPTGESDDLQAAESDNRWVKIRRPTVIVGGELTLDSLEIRHDHHTKVSEAPLQLKSNCGCLLIDDFGRQRVDPTDLLNRWIVPLENQCDYLTMRTGKKIQVPFEQLIIFSTNLDPKDLADEAFLRRIAYKVKVTDPSSGEFHGLFKGLCENFGCEYNAEAVDYLISTHYQPAGRPLRRCQPRDLLTQIRNLCAYNGQDLEITPDLFDRVVRSYFTVA